MKIIKNKLFNFSRFIILLTAFGLISQANAAVVLQATRVLFSGKNQEQSVSVMNNGGTPSLVQSWVAQNNKKSNDFMVTPPLFRLEGGGTSSLRIVKMNQNLPNNVESLYWLNVKAVPPVDPNAGNSVSFAINTQIRLFYRPEALMNSDAIDSAHKKLTFTVRGDKLIVKNPTPYFVVLKELKIGNEEIKTPGTIDPLKEQTYEIKKAKQAKQVTWIATKTETGTAYPLQTQSLK